jgi:hypothetical protein
MKIDETQTSKQGNNLQCSECLDSETGVCWTRAVPSLTQLRLASYTELFSAQQFPLQFDAPDQTELKREGSRNEKKRKSREREKKETKRNGKSKTKRRLKKKKRIESKPREKPKKNQ